MTIPISLIVAEVAPVSATACRHRVGNLLGVHLRGQIKFPTNQSPPFTGGKIFTAGLVVLANRLPSLLDHPPDNGDQPGLVGGRAGIDLRLLDRRQKQAQYLGAAAVARLQGDGDFAPQARDTVSHGSKNQYFRLGIDCKVSWRRNRFAANSFCRLRLVVGFS